MLTVNFNFGQLKKITQLILHINFKLNYLPNTLKFIFFFCSCEVWLKNLNYTNLDTFKIS